MVHWFLMTAPLPPLIRIALFLVTCVALVIGHGAVTPFVTVPGATECAAQWTLDLLTCGAVIGALYLFILRYDFADDAQLS